MYKKITSAIFCSFLAFTHLSAKNIDSQVKIIKYAADKNVADGILLNPHLYSPNYMFAQDMVYEGFVAFSEDSRIIPSLASSWKISDDGKTYTFYLRKGVKFSNGEIFDAKAVKANFDAIMQNKERHSWLGLTKAFKNLEIVDDFSVKLHLNYVYEPTLKELTLIRPFRFIAPSAMKNASTKDGVKYAAGTGRWILKESQNGVLDRFVKNENYWGDKAKVDEIISKVIPDPATRIVALKTGDVDYIYGDGAIGFEDFKKLQNDKNYKTIVSKPLSTTLLALNTAKFPTNNKSVRLALNIAINKDVISKYVFNSTQPKADFFFALNVPNTKIDRLPYTYNLKAANKLLDDDGWILNSDGIRYKNGQKLKINLFYKGTNAEHKAIAEVMQHQFKKIGVDLIINADETSVLMRRQKTGEFDMTFNDTWGAPYDADLFLTSMLEPAHADYMAQLGLAKKPYIDSLIKKLPLTINNEEKAKIIKEVLTILHDEAVYIPVVYATNKGVASNKLKGYKSSILKYCVPFDEIDLR